ncbi:MAG: hypothetical protein ACM3WR_06955 [Solirubrobacterales bacterium]
MRAELYRPDAPEEVVAVATWKDSSADLEAGPDAPEGLGAILRPTPLVIDDPSLRAQGTHGEILLEPGSLPWFRAALQTRTEALGLAVRFVPGVREGGWDPAGLSRTFEQQVERLTARA